MTSSRPTGIARLSRALDLRPGEAAPALLLLAHSLFVGIAFAFFFSFANAAFLSSFEIEFLPYAYVAAGIVGYLTVALFSALERRLGLGALLAGNLLFLLLALGGFRLGFMLSDSRWLSLLAFVWIDPLATLLDLGFWGLAGRLLDLQQAKRLFGLVSSGQSLSQIGSFFLVPALLPLLFHFSDLLVVAALGVGLCVAVLLFALRRFPARFAARPVVAEAAAGPQSHGLFADRYFLLISLLVGTIVLILYFVDFSFLSVTLSRFPEATALASYLALFWGVTQAAEWAVKTFLSGRLVGQFGLGFGLLSYPLAVLLCVALAGASGAVAGGAALGFFVFVSAAKQVEFVARRALFDPASKVLFQPLPEERRFAFQTRVEGGVKQAALGLAGLALIAIGAGGAGGAGSGELAAVRVLLFLLPVAVGLAFLVHRQYRGKLREVLAGRPAASLVVSTAEVVLREVRSLQPPELGYALSLLESVAPALLDRLLLELLDSPHGEVRGAAVHHLAALEQVAAVDFLAFVAGDDLDPAVRAAAAAAAHMLAVLDRRAPEAALLAFSEDPAERRRAALLVAQAGAAVPQETVAGLLWDVQPSVRRAALTAAGRLDQPELWPRLIEQLRERELARSAAAALVEIGSSVLPALDLQFRRSGHEPETLLHLLRVMERIGGERAKARLLAKLNHPRRAVRRQVLYSLGALGYRAVGEEIGSFKQKIEEVVDRIAWLTAARLDVGEEAGTARLAAALEREAAADTELLFLLLTLIADSGAVALMRDPLQAASGEARAYVIELAEAIIPGDVKRAVLPILEQLPPAPLLERLSGQFPQRSLSRGERLSDVLQQGGGYIGSWTRACALEVFRPAPNGTAPAELAANLFHADPLVQEMAAFALREVEPTIYPRYLGKLPEAAASALAAVLPPGAGSGGEEARGLLRFDKVLLLGRTEIFGAIPEPVLARSAGEFAEVRRQAGEAIFRAGEPGRQLYVIAAGTVEIHDGERAIKRMKAPEILGEMAVVSSGTRSLSATAVEPVRLLRIERTALLEILGEHLVVLPEIVRVIAGRRAVARAG
ncbi:MAG TPA: cyclic nucleotide-binding domain-containing protein [Thermoanaerobaculia bacterium]|nr:cyclic nucleotide-binding domain-containing protein [Thermoanaerobaculia bacterium]